MTQRFEGSSALTRSVPNEDDLLQVPWLDDLVDDEATEGMARDGRQEAHPDILPDLWRPPRDTHRESRWLDQRPLESAVANTALLKNPVVMRRWLPALVEARHELEAEGAAPSVVADHGARLANESGHAQSSHPMEHGLGRPGTKDVGIRRVWTHHDARG